ncbi:MAG: pantetheine-phosphate adenylyltransferase [Clostridia bacterium]|nr:pantetheine-phosphate adenylyltransferase [Clostridia bacterium]
MKKTIVMFPGSFDPVTRGHMDIIRRAARMFDRVIVAVMVNPEKRGCFPFEKRVEMLEKACSEMKNVSVIHATGLTAEVAREMNVTALVRGVRNVSDLEAENAMAHINGQLVDGLDTVYFPATMDKSNISSTFVRQLASYGADISAYVPEEVLDDIKSAFEK